MIWRPNFIVFQNCATSYRLSCMSCVQLSWNLLNHEITILKTKFSGNLIHYIYLMFTNAFTLRHNTYMHCHMYGWVLWTIFKPIRGTLSSLDDFPTCKSYLVIFLIYIYKILGAQVTLSTLASMARHSGEFMVVHAL